MPEKNLAFQEHLKNEIKKVRGAYVPVRAGFLRRLLIRRTSCKKLHPNPDDEFCSPTIGPNAGIIANYCKMYRTNGSYSFVGYESEPLTVEKARPDGYLILNGHHRWAAALQCRIRTLPIHIVDLPHESDIDDMLQSSRSDRRVTLDLDEVVFCMDRREAAEKPLPFPYNLRHKQRLRKGIPALFLFLNKRGYDIWVYSAKYYSFRDIHDLFSLYHIHVTGIVTGTARKGNRVTAVREKLKKNAAEHYATTLHIDRGGMQRVDSRTGDYEEYAIDGSGTQWSAQIMDLIGVMDSHV